MNQGQTLCLALLHGLFIRVVIVRAVQDNFCPIGARGGDLSERRRKRHDDARVNPVASGVIRNALRMIAGRSGDHTVIPFLGGESEQLVKSTAFLESASALLIVEFQEN